MSIVGKDTGNLEKIEIRWTTRDDSFIVLPAAVFFFILLLCILLLSGVSAMTIGGLVFIVAAGAGKLLQTVWPEIYMTTITPEDVSFCRIDRESPSLRFQKVSVACFETAPPPWYHGKGGKTQLKCSVKSGQEIKIDVRFIWNGNRDAFYDAIDLLWGNSYTKRGKLDGKSDKQKIAAKCSVERSDLR